MPWLKYLPLCVVLCAMTLLGADAQPPTVKPLPGHSYHGEAFDEGPRQKAYLLGTTGNVHFPVTTKNPLAQQFFDQGVGQLHGFWYYEAERSFRQAALLDPDCGMAYWGMAQANLNNDKRAKSFMAEAVKRKAALTERERLYIDALDAWFNKAQNGKQKERGQAYVNALEQLLYKFPDDIEARSLLALQIWKNKDAGIQISSPLAVDAIQDQVFKANPMHPTHHYRIHLWDSTHSDNALKSAALCGQSAPGIAHMWHMPGHIYSDLKRYGDAAWQQEASGRVDHAYMIRDGILPDQIHNYAHNQEWLIRNQNNIGRVRDAIVMAKNQIEIPRHPKYNTLGHGTANYGRQRLFETLNRYELWDELIALCQTRHLEPTDDESQQVVRLRHLGRAYFRTGDSTNGQQILVDLEQRLKSVQSEKEKAVTTAADKARAEKKDDKTVEKVKGDAANPFNPRINNLERALDEMHGWLADMLGDSKSALDALQKSGLDEMTIAFALLKAGQGDEAEKKAREAANQHKYEVRVLCKVIELLWQRGKRDDAAKFFAELREISTHIDMSSPVFTRLNPIATDLGLPADWRIVKPAAADTGNRPDQNTLGPYGWHPTAAPRWSLKDVEGKDVSLDLYAGKPVVLIFFLGHGCLHCAQQLQAFAPRTKEFADAGISIVAISTDDPMALQKSVDTFKPATVPFPLASNANLDVFKAYRCHDDFENQPLHGTFFIDGQGFTRWQDIGPEPFMDANFVLQEAKRLLTFPAKENAQAVSQAK